MSYTTAGYGATINGKHTLRDYGLVIGNTDIVEEPTPKTNYIDIPGSSHRLDLTETLTGNVAYNSRQLKFSLGGFMAPGDWPEFYSALMNELHGKSVEVVLDNDPLYYYSGRAQLSGFARTGRLGTFTLTVNADAYKYEITSSTDDWIWDTFSFEDGIIREYSDIAVSGSTSKFIDGSDIPVVPVFYISDLSTATSAYVTYNGVKHTFSEGKNRFGDIVIPTAGARLYFYGTYTMTIEFRGGSL